MAKSNQNKFIWYSLRIGFWLMMLLWVLNVLFPVATPEDYWNGPRVITTLLWVSSIVFTFVSSIIHLVRYKKKAFAVVSLVISSYLMLTLLMGIIIGSVGGAA